MKKFDLGWGNAVAVRKAFLNNIDSQSFHFHFNDANLEYTPHNGDETLTYITKFVIERQVGPTYRHIFLTNGATGAITIALRAYAQQGYQNVFTRKPPFFSIYPGMAKAANLNQFWDDKNGQENNPGLYPGNVLLLDSPANPSGEVMDNMHSFGAPVIWDAVYNNNVYTHGNHKPLSCDVLIGSYSKLLGLNGIRVGWIATNDDLLAIRLKALVEAEYCGLSSASYAVLKQALKWWRSKIFWENFEVEAQNSLDANRTEWSKLEKYFWYEPVSHNGMFYYAHIDSACRRLLEKSSIAWTNGESLGTSDEFGRFNIGQDREVVGRAVKAMLKNDKRTK